MNRQNITEQLEGIREELHELRNVLNVLCPQVERLWEERRQAKALPRRPGPDVKPIGMEGFGEEGEE